MEHNNTQGRERSAEEAQPESFYLYMDRKAKEYSNIVGAIEGGTEELAFYNGGLAASQFNVSSEGTTLENIKLMAIARSPYYQGHRDGDTWQRGFIEGAKQFSSSEVERLKEENEILIKTNNLYGGNIRWQREVRRELETRIKELQSNVTSGWKKISICRDGGTIVLEDNNGIKYYEDHRLGTKTPGVIYDKYPGDADAKIITPFKQ